MAKELKKLIVEEMTREYSGVDRCVVVNLTGIPSETAARIRARLREHHITLKVVKNSLMARAFANVGLGKLVGLLEGPCAIATGGADVVELAKVITELAGKAKIEIRGGYGEGQLLASGDVRRFATIPARPTLIAGFLWAAKGPVRRMAATLGTFTRGFVTALDAVAKKRGESGT